MTTIQIPHVSMLYRLKSPLFLLLLVLFLLSFLAACGSMVEVVSTPASSPVAIDGDDADWQGKTWYVEDKNASVGFQHRGDFLYVFFKTGSRTVQMQVLRGGLTVWLDPEGGSDEYIGIRYPRPGAGGADMRPGRSVEFGGTDDEQTRLQVMRDAVRECEVIGPGDGERRIAPLLDDGIDAQLSMKGGTLIYEMQVPLGGSGPDAIAVARPEDGALGVGFKTRGPEDQKRRNEIDPPQQRDRRPGGMGGTMPGGMGRRPQGTHMLRDVPESLTLWTKVKM